MLPALVSIASQQANHTERIALKEKQLLDYAATHPNAIITYCASDMVLAGHRNASYLSKSKSRSRAGGHFFLTDDSANLPNNNAVMTIYHIYQSSHVFGGGSRTSRTFRQLPWSYSSTNCPRVDGTQAAANAHANSQHNFSWGGE